MDDRKRQTLKGVLAISDTNSRTLSDLLRQRGIDKSPATINSYIGGFVRPSPAIENALLDIARELENCNGFRITWKGR